MCTSSRAFLVAYIMAIAILPNGSDAFPIHQIPLSRSYSSNSYSVSEQSSMQSLHTSLPIEYQHRPTSTSLYSSTKQPPMRPMEEEREKNDKKDREWKQVVGGFVPKFLKRSGTSSSSAQDAGATQEGNSIDNDTVYRNVQSIDTIQDYKTLVVDEPEKIVVVRYFAPWCKSCKAAHPLFKRLVTRHSPQVKFVEVPLTKETSYIHEGLGVPSVPYAHIYHPDVGLVEEMKINKKVFGEFEGALESYVRGSCDLPVEENQDGEFEGEGEESFQ
mmetsp:Transcript_9786/g.21795  ORF Transcript_9786/g.21795 Transcript_9786/m.21795 type:complete len:273 (-) Transcript_9786:203-1021(-)